MNMNKIHRTVLLSALIVSMGVFFLVNQDPEIIEPSIEQWYLTGDPDFIVDIGWNEMWEVYTSIPDIQ